MQAKKPELILPAGNFENLKAAVLNGADSVYGGAKKFNARIPAANFAENELNDGIDYCHLHGKRFYLTLNTLIKDSELEEAIGIAKNAFELGVDAIICQDLGLINALRELLPELEIHASTQTTCHNSAGAKFLENLGVKKIVLARELSLQEIKEIKKSTSAGIECFIHGALCFSYSGQCLFSSFAFNKSGNRGRCLQPCRLKFELYSKEGIEKGFVLSMKDLMTIYGIKELINAGIDSFKVEGRLKGIAYVASVARAYRKAIDSCFGNSERPSEEDVKLMKIAFLREATKGYFFEQETMTFPETPMRKGVLAAKVIGFKGRAIRLKLFESIYKWDRLTALKDDSLEEFSAAKIFRDGKEVPKAIKGNEIVIETGEKPFLEIGQELFFTSHKLLKDLEEKALFGGKKVFYSLKVFAKVGENLKAIAEFAGKKSEVEFDFRPEAAKTSEFSEKMLKERLFKEDDFFKPVKFEAKIDGKIFIPVSKLKEFQKAIMDSMREKFFEEFRKTAGSDFEGRMKRMLNFKAQKIGKEKREIAVFCDSVEQAGLAKENADFIAFYDCVGLEKIEKFAKENPAIKIFVKSSNIQSDKELQEFEKNFLKAKTPIICSNLGVLQKAIEAKSRFWADRELNCFNSLSARLLAGLGAERIIPSSECSLQQLEMISEKQKIMPLVFQYPLLMTSKAFAKNRKPGRLDLKDRKGFAYRAVVEQNGLFRIYNPVPLSMIFEVEKFGEFSAIGLDFREAGVKEAKESLEFLREKLAGKSPRKEFAKFTRGHYFNELE
ncbi:MAG: U32 family peptidase [Candidatus Diapherotrites archaeon]|nr:U32 family peptidase [Candidatus Diapherotrites archaeon]